MPKLLAVMTLVAFSVALVGCGGETPQPAKPVAEPDLGATGAIPEDLPTLDSGSGTGASGALAPPATDDLPGAGASAESGDQPTTEGESAATDGPTLPGADK